MDQFNFTSKQKTLTFALMAVGILSIIITALWYGEHHQARLWTNILHNSVFFTGIAFLTLMFLAGKTLAYAGWHAIFKRVMEAMISFLPVGLLLMGVVIVGLLTHSHHIYHWAADGITDPSSSHYDAIIAGKSGFLNTGVYVGFTIGFGLLWCFIANKLRSISLAEDNAEEGDVSFFKKSKFWSAVMVPIGGFSSAALIWLWIMSIDPHWYSTMFAWYTTISWFVSALAILILLIIYLKSLGYFPEVTREHYHDLAKYLFGFSVFWTYLWFDQFMLIWYANVGEETIYFDLRQLEFPVLFYGNLIINFVLPFLILIGNMPKRREGVLVFMCVVLVLGHWLDFFQMIKPGVYTEMHAHAAHSDDHHGETHGDAYQLNDAKPLLMSNNGQLAQHDGAHGEDHHDADHGHTNDHGTDHTAGDHQIAANSHSNTSVDFVPFDDGSHGADHGHGHHDDGHGHHEESKFELGWHFPGFLEIGTMLGYLGLFLFVVFTALSRAKLVPGRDPYLGESKTHEVLHEDGH